MRYLSSKRMLVCSPTEEFFWNGAQVLHVQGEGNRRIMYVWDGTDAPPLPKR